jgi:membrane protein DedA with SNARE-associated domain
MLAPLGKLILSLLRYKYALVFPLGIVEGPIITIICGFLLHQGYFHFWPLYLLLVLADLAGDAVWYGVGYWGFGWALRRYGHFVSLNPGVVEKIQDKFKQHQNKTLLISKMTTGFGFAVFTLMTAGTIRVPLKNFFAINILGGLWWTGLMLALGYFYGHFYGQFDAGIRTASLVIFIIIVAALLYGFQRYIRSTVTRPLA